MKALEIQDYSFTFALFLGLTYPDKNTRICRLQLADKVR